MSGLNNQKELKLDNERKIALLKMFKAFLQTAPRGTQQMVLDSARGENKLPYNRYLKGAFSTHLKNPDKWYSKVPNEVYESIITTLKKTGKESITDSEAIQNIEDNFGLALSLFVDEKISDKEESSRSLIGKYWSYSHSMVRKGYLSKSLMVIAQTNSGVLATEELFCYPKKGSPNLIDQKAVGYVVGKKEFFLFLQRDTHSPLPRIYIMRPTNYNGAKCTRLVGKRLSVNRNDENVRIISRKILLIREDNGLPTERESLVKSHGLGIHDPRNASDTVIKEIYDMLKLPSES